MDISLLFQFLDVVGTAAFAVSGATVAMKKRFDLFGVLFIAAITATGGGMLRDIVLGLTPPAALMHPSAFLFALTAGLATFFLGGRLPRKGERLFLYSDALGLGVFTAVGAAKALLVPDTNIFLAIFSGMLTGIGGGMLRDILARELPFVLRREVYATASVIGSLVLVLAIPLLGEAAAGLLCCLVVSGLRIVAIQKHLHIPRASLRKPGGEKPQKPQKPEKPEKL